MLDTRLFVTVLIHATVLLTFLFLFYVTVGAQYKARAAQADFDRMMRTDLATVLETADRDSNGDICKATQELTPGFQIQRRAYARPSPAIAISNKRLRLTASLLVFFVAAMLAVVVTLLTTATSAHPLHLGRILGEAARIFLLVGAAELIFFRFVALPSIPTLPSETMKHVVVGLRQDVF